MSLIWPFKDTIFVAGKQHKPKVWILITCFFNLCGKWKEPASTEDMLKANTISRFASIHGSAVVQWIAHNGVCFQKNYSNIEQGFVNELKLSVRYKT